MTHRIGAATSSVWGNVRRGRWPLGYRASAEQTLERYVVPGTPLHRCHCIEGRWLFNHLLLCSWSKLSASCCPSHRHQQRNRCLYAGGGVHATADCEVRSTTITSIQPLQISIRFSGVQVAAGWPCSALPIANAVYVSKAEYQHRGSQYRPAQLVHQQRSHRPTCAAGRGQGEMFPLTREPLRASMDLSKERATRKATISRST